MMQHKARHRAREDFRPCGLADFSHAGIDDLRMPARQEEDFPACYADSSLHLCSYSIFNMYNIV